jgi:hypothetical protein
MNERTSAILAGTRPREVSDSRLEEKKIFTYAEAQALLPEVRGITEEAAATVEQVKAAMLEQGASENKIREQVDRIVGAWARALVSRGLEVKGLWLVDFDNGSGYYCWRHPETSLQFFHSYEDGFLGRVRIQ